MLKVRLVTGDRTPVSGEKNTWTPAMVHGSPGNIEGLTIPCALLLGLKSFSIFSNSMLGNNTPVLPATKLRYCQQQPGQIHTGQKGDLCR
ncbi:hypothetical protein FKM82_030815 [Ascaphus truei]